LAEPSTAPHWTQGVAARSKTISKWFTGWQLFEKIWDIGPSGSSPISSKDFCVSASAITGAHPLNTLSAFPPANTAPYILGR
jgi:hypothetical protein